MPGLGDHAEGSLPAVWLTPLPWAPAALRGATAPFLLVGGTADRFWDGALAFLDTIAWLPT